MSLAEAAATVKSCILSRKEDTTVEVLKADYYELMGEPIPFQKLGFNSLTNLLEALPGITLKTNLNGKTIVKAVSEKAAHISELVSRQQASKKKKKNKKIRNIPMAHKRNPLDAGYGPGSTKARDFPKSKNTGAFIHGSGPPKGRAFPKAGNSMSFNYGSGPPKGRDFPKAGKPTSLGFGARPAPQKLYPAQKDKFQTTSVASQKLADSVPPWSSAVDSQKGTGGGKGLQPAEEAIMSSSGEDWFTDEENYFPLSAKSEVSDSTSGDVRCKVRGFRLNTQDLGKSERFSVESNSSSASVPTSSSRLIPHRSFKRPPYEPTTAAGIERAGRNCPCCIFRELLWPQKKKTRRTVMCIRDSLIITVRNNDVGNVPSMNFNQSFCPSSPPDISFEDEDITLIQSVVKSLPDGWEPPPCCFDYYFLGDDFLMDFVAEEMNCDYNSSVIRSSCLCFSGFTIDDAYEFLKALDWVPKRVCVLVGYIDILRGHLLECIKKDMKKLVKFLSRHTDQVVVCTLPLVVSSHGYNPKIARLNTFISSLASRRITVIECQRLFTDGAGCIDESYYEERAIDLPEVPEPAQMWSLVGRMAFYDYIFKKLKVLYSKSIHHFLN